MARLRRGAGRPGATEATFRSTAVGRSPSTTWHFPVAPSQRLQGPPQVRALLAGNGGGWSDAKE